MQEAGEISPHPARKAFLPLGHIFYAKYSIQQEAAQNSPTPRKL